MTDIVERLRDDQNHFDRQEVMREAADEIERLRTAYKLASDERDAVLEAYGNLRDGNIKVA